MLAGQSYQQQEVQLGPCDVLVLYTDGVTEAVGAQAVAGSDALGAAAASRLDDKRAARAAAAADDEVGGEQERGEQEGDDQQEGDDHPERMFGEEQLLAVVHASARLSAVAIKEAILGAVARHTAGTPQSDDITLVVLKRQPD
jgi:serine phosphatase RsbU (regulator of sigma subunit)